MVCEGLITGALPEVSRIFIFRPQFGILEIPDKTVGTEPFPHGLHAFPSRAVQVQAEIYSPGEPPKESELINRCGTCGEPDDVRLDEPFHHQIVSRPLRDPDLSGRPDSRHGLTSPEEIGFRPPPDGKAVVRFFLCGSDLKPDTAPGIGGQGKNDTPDDLHAGALYFRGSLLDFLPKSRPSVKATDVTPEMPRLLIGTQAPVPGIECRVRQEGGPDVPESVPGELISRYTSPHEI